MLKYLCLLAFVASVKSGEEFNHMIKKGIDQYNFKVKCWGQKNVDHFHTKMNTATEKCMQQEPSFDVKEKLMAHSNPFAQRLHQQQANNPFENLLDGNLSELKSLWRSKRSAHHHGQGYHQSDKTDMLEFLDDFRSWGNTMATSIGNLTCVLKEMKCLDEDFNINIDHYRNMGSEPGFDVEDSYCKDPKFMEKMIEGFNDCYNIQESWPRSALIGKPISRMFGRQMVFFKCAKKMENKLCAMGQMKEWQERYYGQNAEQDLTDFGLPEDRYEAAYIASAVHYESATPEEKVIKEFFMGH